MKKLTPEELKTLQLEQAAHAAGLPAARRTCPHCRLPGHYSKKCTFILVSAAEAPATAGEMRAIATPAPPPAAATGGDTV